MNENTLRKLLSGAGRRTHRAVVERWVITGTLKLETPAHFGAGRTGDYTDMPLLLDEQGRPLLPGTSIAGALRNALRERELGDAHPLPSPPRQDDKAAQEAYHETRRRERDLMSTLLFGFFQGDDDDDGGQSALIVEDASGRNVGFELRDGVAIDGITRTAAIEYDEQDRMRGKKYDMELLAAGTTFDLAFELAVTVPRPPVGYDEKEKGPWPFLAHYQSRRADLLAALATALEPLERGDIALGARKRRGFGQCRVSQWGVQRFDLRTRDGLLAWLAHGREMPVDVFFPPPRQESSHIVEAIAALSGGPIHLLDEHRRRVRLDAEFAVASSLLIRSGFGDELKDTPDMIHLQSRRDDGRRAIVSGTSWGGILRHRATRIAKTIGGDVADEQAAHLIDGLFGPAEITTEDPYARASRLSVRESTVEGGKALVQTRVRIDRFTGGALDTALFDQQPLFGTDDARVGLSVEIRPPAPPAAGMDAAAVPPAEIGLLLLLLKDLWTGDLRIGGEASVGRGELSGLEATLKTDDGEFIFTQVENALRVEGDRAILQGYIDALHKEVTNHE